MGGYIKPVERSKWATPLVIVLKSNGKLWACGDFKVTKSVHGDKDISIAYHRRHTCMLGKRQYLYQTRLVASLLATDDSKDLLVVNRPKVLFRYNHLPYGASEAPAILQSVMNRILHYLLVVCYLGDVFISATIVEEHDVLAEKVLQRLQDAGINLHEENVNLVKGK